MRIVLHTPRVFIEEVDVPGIRADMDDVDVLAAARGYDGVSRLSASTVDTGPTFVFARGETDLAAAGRRIAEARASEAAAREAARSVGLAALADGASEREVATTLGIDRNTVRAWRGKVVATA